MKAVIGGNALDVSCSKTPAAKIAADASVMFFEEDDPGIETAMKKAGVTIRRGEFSGKEGTSVMVMPAGREHKARCLIITGLGKKPALQSETLRRAAALAAQKAKEAKYKSIVVDVDNHRLPAQKAAQPVAEGILLGLYSFDRYKTAKEHRIEKVVFCSSGNIEKIIRTAVMLSETVSFVRDLVNTPASYRTPKIFASVAKKECNKYRIRCRSIGRSAAKKMGMNAFLAVASGSAQEPQFLVMEWNPKAKHKIALVGKGITFDSGGLDIKPSDYMLGMHSDMEGAAVVLGTMIAAARSRLPVHVIGITPLAENMPSGSAYKPGDIIKSYSGKTIEVINTDAEGRVVLADALAYAEKKHNPEAIIDMATLTGACVIALGHEAAGLIGNDQKLVNRIKDASAATDERVWQLPLWDDYRELVKSDVADVRNTGKEKGAAGTITAAAFLEAFMEKKRWAHLDIAGVTLYEKQKHYMPKGSTGWGVRLLHRLLSEWS